MYAHAHRYYVSLVRLCAELCSGNNAAAINVVSTEFPHDAILTYLSTKYASTGDNSVSGACVETSPVAC